MDSFNLDFDLEGKGYIVVVKPQSVPDGTLYDAMLDEDSVIRFMGAADGSLIPMEATGVEPRLINAIATRILERIHVNERRKEDTSSIP